MKLLLERSRAEIVVVDSDVKANGMASLVDRGHGGPRKRHANLEIVTRVGSLECERSVVRGFSEDAGDVILRHHFPGKCKRLLRAIGQLKHGPRRARRCFPEIVEDERMARAVHEVKLMVD